MGLSGNLRTMPFADLLQFLRANQSTGTLQIRRQQIVKMIFFEKGKIISSSSSDPREYLGHFLVSHGLIDEEELRMAMEIQRTSKMLLGKILVMGGKVGESEMAQLLKLKAQETVYSLFLWDEGDFSFYQDEFINRLLIRIVVEPQSLIFEGVLRRDEWLRIREVFPHNNVVLEKVPEASPDLSSADPKRKMIFSLVDGRNSIDDLILYAHSVDYQVCRTLFSLYEEGAIRIKKIMEAPTEKRALGGDHTIPQLVALGKEKLDKGRFEEVLDLFRQIETAPEEYRTEIASLLERAEKETIRDIHSKALPADKVVRLLIPLEQVAHAGLTPEEGFLLSRIDGTWDVGSILSVTPMKEVDVLRLLRKLQDRGIIG